MAQAKTKNTRNLSEPAIPPRLIRLGREVLVIALAALTGYLLICLVSYSSTDPGWTSTGDGGPIRNLGGRFGAWPVLSGRDLRSAPLTDLREGDGAVAPGGAATPRGGWVHVVACVEINQCGGCVVDGVEVDANAP